jgi:hypothetical protein
MVERVDLRNLNQNIPDKSGAALIKPSVSLMPHLSINFRR